MQKKSSQPRTFILSVCIGFAFYVALIFYFVPETATYRLPVLPIERAIVIPAQAQGIPVRIIIPAINVSAVIERTGITPEGQVGVPNGPTNAAWFDESAIPGDEGNALIVGHFGWKNGIPAVFDNLSALQKGDKIYIGDANGATNIFVVRELRTYGKNDDSSDVFYTHDGKAHLRIVTCSGIWDRISKNYSTRLVVFADKETIDVAIITAL
jgi:LPXTG-site transpeptidase (sortase) family protein